MFKLLFSFLFIFSNNKDVLFVKFKGRDKHGHWANITLNFHFLKSNVYGIGSALIFFRWSSDLMISGCKSQFLWPTFVRMNW